MQNFVQIGQTIAENRRYRDFFNFQDGGHTPS